MVTFYLRCMASETKRFHCNVIFSPPPGRAARTFHERFCKCEHAFLIAFHSLLTYQLWCMVSEITSFYCKPRRTSSWFLRQGAFHDEFWKTDHGYMIMIHNNFLYEMHGFRDNDVSLPTGYYVIVSPPPGCAARDFSWRILKEQPWLPDSVP